MGRSWTGTAEHRKLSGELVFSGSRFPGLVAPLLRAALRERIGLALPDPGDLPVPTLAWQEEGVASLVALCLWFEKDFSEEEKTQRAVAALRAFRASGGTADILLLVHSADLQEGGFRAAVQAELSGLLAAGRAGQAELWNRQKLLKEAFDGMLRHTLTALQADALSSVSMAAVQADFTPLEQVPCREATLLLDQHGLKDVFAETPPRFADPAEALLRPGDRRLGLLIGEFGVGKTTTVARALARESAHVLYVAGARFGRRDVSTKDFFYHFWDDRNLFAGLPEEELPTFRLLARPALEYILKGHSKLPILAIVDGVDESALLGRQGGFQHLFNLFHDVGVPVVLTMRTELWTAGQEEFLEAFGLPSERVSPRHRQVRLIELLLWGEEQVRTLVERYRESLPEPASRARLAELEGLLGTGEFERLFGDIPLRPLFLRLLLDTVAAQGLPRLRVGRARLLHDWARRKIQRDINAPIRAGGEGRGGLLAEDESSATVVDLAWEAMLRAAAAMVEKVEEAPDLTLVSECAVKDVLRASPHLQEIEPHRLASHSLLLLVGRETMGDPLRFRFAHRSFQEFFLAWHAIAEGRPGMLGRPLPPAVGEWVRSIGEEGLLPVPPTDLDTEIEIEIRTEFRGGWTHLDFVVHAPPLDFHRCRIEGKAIRGRPEEFQAQLLRKLEQLEDGLDAGAEPLLFAEIERKLTGIGRDLYRELFPPEMQQVYHRLRKRGLALLLTTDEPWIPWELVRPYDASDPKDIVDDDFLCFEFPMTRWFSDCREAPLEIRIRKLAWLGSGGLPHAGEEEKLVRALATSEVEDASPAGSTVAALEALLEEGGTGLLHFTGHGDHESAQPNESSLVLADRPFRPEDLHGGLATQIGRDRPLVFLNACRVAQQDWWLTGLGGWAERWVRACGCGAFVAPLWAVNDRLAFEFARAFYGALERGETLGRAGLAARREVRERSPGQPTWLAYVMYGRVGGRIVTVINREKRSSHE